MDYGSTLIGILGTLAGVIVGAYGSWKIQERQLEHENRSRFHDLRLAAYAEFSGAVNLVVATAEVSDEHDLKATGRIIETMDKITLIASTEVNQKATVVHAHVRQIISATEKKAKAIELKNQIVKDLAAFNHAARKELDIDER